MPVNDAAIVPVVRHGIVTLTGGGGDVMLDGAPLHGTGNARLIEPMPSHPFVLSRGEHQVTIRPGDWQGHITTRRGRLVFGEARDLARPDTPVIVTAFCAQGVLAHATTTPDGKFTLVLPHIQQRQVIYIGIAGSDLVLDGGTFSMHPPGAATPALSRNIARARTIRIKISTPNLKEAPMWGDYHFAVSLRKSFEKLGQRATVDTHDGWYSRPEDEDVAIVLRGRNRFRTNAEKMSIMWLISHPDRVDADELDDYAHVAVASDIHAAELRRKGQRNVGVLHQATDAALFDTDPAIQRRAASLFVGNSRREYRTMVRWCIQRNLPLELYGGGWEGIVAAEFVRAQNIANDELPRYYASHQVLLNDHWDSMRDHGFLSNRLFDGSATGTPIVTDRVAGLAEVFGDTIASAGDIDEFAALVEDCLTHPRIWLDRAAEARRIVLGAHTFDHRAAQLCEIIDASGA